MRIGIIGGMSFESTLHYYEQINRQVNERAGGLTSADLVLRSVNFEEYHQLMEVGDWEEFAHRLSFEALDLVLKNRCDYVAIATNTMHKVADEVLGPHEVVNNVVWPSTSTWIDVPLVHIGDCIADECKDRRDDVTRNDADDERDHFHHLLAVDRADDRNEQRHEAAEDTYVRRSGNCAGGQVADCVACE